MKKSIILLCALVFTTALTSCSTASKAGSTSARYVEVSPSVEQLPTLVKLQVDSVMVKLDTSWTDSLFHQTLSIRKELDNLTARVLAKYHGDVFVLPKWTWEKEHVGFLRTEHYLSVTGYVGHYTGFRSATSEDVQMLNEYKHGHPSPQAPMTSIHLNRRKGNGSSCGTIHVLYGPGDDRKIKKR